MPSETDPLLPNTEPAPEIVGYGYSRQQRTDHQESKSHYNRDIAEPLDQDGSTEDETQAGTDASPLRTIFTIFTTVVCFGVFLSILMTGKLGRPSNTPHPNPFKPPASVAGRVEKILSDHPLIGLSSCLQIFLSSYSNVKFRRPQ